MPEPLQSRSVIEAAEKAAAAGDYTSADQLLRSAVLLQEAELGPLDPSLANTLNNLGVVCEILDKPDDAEQFYRRAYEIAKAVLAHDHPFVTTSHQNLNDFYRVRGRALESPVAPPAAIEPELQADAVPAPEPERSVAPPVAEAPLPAIESPQLPAKRSSRPLAIGALSVCGLAVVVLIAMGPWSRSNVRSEPSASGSAPSLTREPAPAREAVEPAEPIAAPREAATTSTPSAKEGNRPVPPVTAAPDAPNPPVAAEAKVCRGLATGGSPVDWECTPPSDPAAAGTFSFYTRIKSAQDTTVEHRWYLGDRLYQVVPLRVLANPGSGYRTYSRHTMDAGSAGTWRVELRTSDGILLHEERFVVR